MSKKRNTIQGGTLFKEIRYYKLFFAVLESKYAKDLDEGGSREAIKDIHDYFVKDIIKKGYMGKKMDYLPAFREHYFVLQPQVRPKICIKYSVGLVND